MQTLSGTKWRQLSNIDRCSKFLLLPSAASSIHSQTVIAATSRSPQGRGFSKPSGSYSSSSGNAQPQAKSSSSMKGYSSESNALQAVKSSEFNSNPWMNCTSWIDCPPSRSSDSRHFKLLIAETSRISGKCLNPKEVNPDKLPTNEISSICKFTSGPLTIVNSFKQSKCSTPSSDNRLAHPSRCNSFNRFMVAVNARSGITLPLTSNRNEPKCFRLRNAPSPSSRPLPEILRVSKLLILHKSAISTRPAPDPQSVKSLR